MRRRLMGAFASIAIIAIATIVPLVLVPGALRSLQKMRGDAEVANRTPKPTPAIRFADDGKSIDIPKDQWDMIGLKVLPIEKVQSSRTISMDGILYLDPEDYVAVRSRFTGEFVDVASVPDTNLPGQSTERSIRFGDEVQKGQLLGSVWSRELGEKKSELAQFISSLKYDRETLSRLTAVQTSIPTGQIREAERRVRESEIGVERIEKTLRSWQLSMEEIRAIQNEIGSEAGGAPSADALSKRNIDKWARIDIRSPINGTLIEKNVTVGAMVDQDDTLFKVANLDHLDVRAFAFEEDIASIQRIPKDQRKWMVRLKSEQDAPPIEGVFDRIGGLIDPVQHTGLVMGWVDNAERMLRPGQFITAAIALPDSEPLIRLPTNALIEFDGKSFVLVALEHDSTSFHRVEVRVVRYQSHEAFVGPDTNTKEIPALGDGMQVIASPAAEIFADYQQHLSSLSMIPKPGHTSAP